MKTSIFIISIFFIVSCASSLGIVHVQYKHASIEDPIFRNVKYSMMIPSGYKLITLVGGHEELENQYTYSDSTKIYISDFGCSILNYNNILLLGDIIANKRFESLELTYKIAKELGNEYKPETLLLEGKTVSGLYWKDIRIGYVSIGYVNVPENRKSEFDKALSSFFDNK